MAKREMAYLGNHIRVFASSEETGGLYTAVEMTFDAGFKVPAHMHGREVETTFVLEGSLDIWIDGTVTRAGAGEVVKKPKGIPHAMANQGSGRARFLEVYTPGGLEGYFQEVEGLVLSGRVTPESLAAVQRTYAISSVEVADPF